MIVEPIGHLLAVVPTLLHIDFTLLLGWGLTASYMRDKEDV
ncbi:MAG: hypothetical protein ACQEWU_17780 [Bacillota bacterium]|nr:MULTISPECIES: hypothetical protein [Bacillaceae]WBX81053.1 hypothetical protein PD280_04545 [Virgibacillus salarius]